MIADFVQFIREEWADAKRMAFGEKKPPQVPDEQSLIRRASEARAARDFLDSPTVADFMTRQEAKLIETLLSLPPDDDQGRYRMAVAVNSVRQLRRYLAASAQDGRLAEAELERVRKGATRMF